MRIQRFAVGPLQANAYLATCPETGWCALIDPGDEPERLLATVEEQGARLERVLLTHAHLDHVGGVAHIRRRTGAPVYLHPADLPLYRSAPQQARSFGLDLEVPPDPDHELADGQSIAIGKSPLEVRHTPGHSPGHVTFVGPGFAFVGDCVFAGSIGRSDLPGGDHRVLLSSIHDRILTLDDETVLYTGHGPETSVGHERRANPFLTGAFGWSG